MKRTKIGFFHDRKVFIRPVATKSENSFAYSYVKTSYQACSHERQEKLASIFPKLALTCKKEESLPTARELYEYKARPKCQIFCFVEVKTTVSTMFHKTAQCN